MMALKFAAGLRAFCLVAALLSASAYGAGEPSPLIGLTRDQLLERNGEPKSQIAAGNREVIFFDRERVTLRNGLVTEVELLASEPAPKRVPPSESGATAAPLAGQAAAPAAPEPSSPAPPEPAAGQQAVAGVPASSPPPEPQSSIKLVRPPGASVPRPTPKQQATLPVPVANQGPADGGTTLKMVRPALPANSKPGSVAGPSRSITAPVAGGGASPADSAIASISSGSASISSLPPTAPDKLDGPEPATPEEKKTRGSNRPLSEVDVPAPRIFTAQTYVIAILAIGVGSGFLYWQRQQRLLELDATSVSHTPFNPLGTAPTGGTAFPATLLGDLEWKRFEELVESYYGKTGVIAARTRTGPESAVQIKISWKGESRPFALVQCISHPPGLIEAKRIQDLADVLTAEDIRRGYVVTTGKFSIPARDFAEEKHITLMPGDIFLEKINALPASARDELVQEFSAGEYTTPTCPKCDTKMARGADDPTFWRCKTHPEVSIPPWK